MEGLELPSSRIRALPALYDDPNYGKDDDLTYKMSMRDRPTNYEEWKERFPNADADLLVQADNEIVRLRRKISSSSEFEDFMKSHRALRKEWRDEAKEKGYTDLKKIESQIKAKGTGEKEQNLLRILQAVSKWPQEVEAVSQVPLNPEEVAEMEDPEYGLFARVMYFKQGEGGYTHQTKTMDGKFPDQKIQLKLFLDDYNGNPLAEECPKDVFRYFHLPANNMAWIEVSMFCFVELPADGKLESHKNILS